MYRIFPSPKHCTFYHNTLSCTSYGTVTTAPEIEESCRADQCIGCQNCVSHCPQSIQVPEELAKIAAFVSGLEKNE